MNSVKLVLSGVARSLVKAGVDAEELLNVQTFVSNMQDAGVTIDGNFTTVIVKDHAGNMAVGTSKCHPNDAYNPVRGEMLATSRAVRNAMLKQLSGRMDLTKVA